MLKSSLRYAIALAAVLLPATTISSMEPAADDHRWVPSGPVKAVDEFIEREIVHDGRHTQRVRRYVFSPEKKVTSIIRYEGPGGSPVTQTFEYDDEGHLVSWTARNANDTTLWGYRYRYNEEGRLLQETEFDRHGRVTGHRAFLYHTGESGETRLEESAYDATGGVLWWMHRTRAANNEDEQWSVYYPDGRVITEGLRRFDAQERLILEEEVDRTTGNRSITRYRYAGHHQPITVEHYSGKDVLQRREVFRYDERGNVTFHRITTATENNHTTRHYQYTYDEYGNWIRRVQWLVRTGETEMPAVERVIHIREFKYH
jgi:antitoxin component YwqK of YwqJK toxin-antitoxin module